MFYYAYVLQSIKNSLYIGYTSELLRRCASHNNREDAATKSFIPYKLIFYEAFLDKIDAKNREIYLKSGYGLRSIKKMLNRYLHQSQL